MTIVVADDMGQQFVKDLREFGEVVYLGNETKERKDALLRTELVHATALIVRSATKVTRAMLEMAPKLKVVGRSGVGLDNVDQKACAEKGIIVINTPLSHGINVAEHAAALMLAAAKCIVPADRAMREGQWPKKDSKPTELRSKTLGLIGMGNIGSEFARLASLGFGMDVIFYDIRTVPNDHAQQIPSMEELFARSDVISLHVPELPSTTGMINANSISLMKDGVILVNTSRGGLVVEADLVTALETGKIRAAGLDVFVAEPYGNGALARLKNVVLTPHIASATEEAQARCGEELINRLRAALPVSGVAATFIGKPGANGTHAARRTTGG